MNLAELIFERKGADSYNQLAARTGNAISSPRLQQLATQPIKNFPDPPSIEAIAKALGVDIAAVVLACAESLGLRISRYGTRLGQMLPARVDDLPHNHQEVILNVARALVEALPDEPTPAQAASTELRRKAANAVARTGRADR